MGLIRGLIGAAVTLKRDIAAAKAADAFERARQRLLADPVLRCQHLHGPYGRNATKACDGCGLAAGEESQPMTSDELTAYASLCADGSIQYVVEEPREFVEQAAKLAPIRVENAAYRATLSVAEREAHDAAVDVAVKEALRRYETEGEH